MRSGAPQTLAARSSVAMRRGGVAGQIERAHEMKPWGIRSKPTPVAGFSLRRRRGCRPLRWGGPGGHGCQVVCAGTHGIRTRGIDGKGFNRRARGAGSAGTASTTPTSLSPQRTGHWGRGRGVPSPCNTTWSRCGSRPWGAPSLEGRALPRTCAVDGRSRADLLTANGRP